MNVAPEHKINQGSTGEVLQDAQTFDEAMNLTAAVLQLVHADPEGESVVRSATIASASPSTGAATSCNFRRIMTAADTEDAGVRIYEWKLTLADGAIHFFPSEAPTAEFPNRARPCFQIVDGISVAGDDEDSDPEIASANRPLVVADIDELKALPAPTNSQYRLVIVENDWNDQQASFWFDATIAADDIGIGEVVLTAGGGGFRRRD